MKPTILSGDHIFVNKLAYGLKFPLIGWKLADWSNPGRGDVVVFLPPEMDEYYVKRVVGLPGDEVRVLDNKLIVNGKPADYERLDLAVVNEIEASVRPQHQFASERIEGEIHPVMFTPSKPSARAFGPVTVPADSYFVMGDSRDNSFDSRGFGFVKRDRVVGRATRVLVSLDPSHHSLPRWHRFLRSLP
jgi:signal peptidase I